MSSSENSPVSFPTPRSHRAQSRARRCRYTSAPPPPPAGPGKHSGSKALTRRRRRRHRRHRTACGGGTPKPAPPCRAHFRKPASCKDKTKIYQARKHAVYTQYKNQAREHTVYNTPPLSAPPKKQTRFGYSTYRGPFPRPKNRSELENLLRQVPSQACEPCSKLVLTGNSLFLSATLARGLLASTQASLTRYRVRGLSLASTTRSTPARVSIALSWVRAASMAVHLPRAKRRRAGVRHHRY